MTAGPRNISQRFPISTIMEGNMSQRTAAADELVRKAEEKSKKK